MRKNLLPAKILYLSFDYVLFVIFVLLSNNSFPQLSEGGLPYSFAHISKSITNIPEINTASIDKLSLAKEDAETDKKGVPLRFGKLIEVNIDVLSSGLWETLPDGSKLCRLIIHSQDALTINLNFSDYYLPIGAKLFIYNGDKSEVIGAFSARNNIPTGEFATGIVRGDVVILEYYEPAIINSKAHLVISGVVHGYRDIFSLLKNTYDYGQSGTCNININCPEGADWQNEKRAVAMILTSYNQRICSGTLINNISNNLTPYFLTANHCIEGEQISNWVFMFNYEAPSCKNADGPINYTLNGGVLKANNLASDFALIELNNQPPDSFKVYYAGFSAINTVPTGGAGIHHPEGDIKKISISDSVFKESEYGAGTAINSHWLVSWSKGVTEPGSSGSAIFDNRHRIVGQLHGGNSECFGTDLTDYYGKVAVSWNYGSAPSTRLKDWLDPANTGILAINGMDPSIPLQDFTAPNNITNLSAGSVTSSSLVLQWIVPKDLETGVLGYDIRMSSSPITDNTSFYNSTRLDYKNYAGSPGEIQNLNINGLKYNTTYYFAIKSYDGAGNLSGISNVLQANTLGAPVISLSTDSLNTSLKSSYTKTDSIFISNKSFNPSTLDYQIQLKDNTFPEGFVSANLTMIKSSEKEKSIRNKTTQQDILFGGYVKSSGGPDTSGYVWIDSDSPNGPTFVWNDISSTGTEVTNWTSTFIDVPKDEGIAGPFNIGFNFSFYNQIKTKVYLSTNGLIHFTNYKNGDSGNMTIPSDVLPNDFIAPFWDDLDGTNTGNVYYQNYPDKMVIQYSGWPKFSVPTTKLTFQVILYANGKIQLLYNSVAGVLNQSVIGIEDSTGQTGLMICNDANYVHNGLAVAILKTPLWLSSEPLIGTIYNGNKAKLELNFNAASYPLGDYKMNVVISSNDPISPTVTVPVSMKILPLPVELTSFTSKTEKNNVILNWSTETEKNNNGFVIQRSISGINKFADIGFIKGHGNSTSKLDYSFIDKNIFAGKYDYRLNQMDFNGKNNPLQVLTVDLSAPLSYELSSNYPNPFNPSTKIKFGLPKQSNVNLTIYNILGQAVKELVNGNMEAGYHEVVFNASNLSAGTYIYVLEADNNRIVKKMTLLK